LLWATLLIIAGFALGVLKSPSNRSDRLFQVIGLATLIGGSVLLHNSVQTLRQPQLANLMVGKAPFIEANSLKAIQQELAKAKKEKEEVMLNRGLNCVTRPTQFDRMKEQEVDPINGYGFIPLLLAAGSAVSGMLQGKAKAKQDKYDAKTAAVEAARAREAEQIAAKKKQTMMLLAILGVGGLVMAGIALKKKRR
jgi:hypothetical protein